jgi:hypothetical protein
MICMSGTTHLSKFFSVLSVNANQAAIFALVRADGLLTLLGKDDHSKLFKLVDGTYAIYLMRFCLHLDVGVKLANFSLLCLAWRVASKL